jgi:PAS domain S-box-containing protein
MVELTDSEKAWIEKHKEIVIAFDRDYSPYSFQNNEGKFEGIAVAFAQEMARRAGLNLKHYPDGIWKNLYEAAQKRDVDVIATLVKRPEREDWFEFTEPYISLTQYIITRKGNKTINEREDISDKTLALVESYSTSHYVLEEFPTVKPYYVKDLTEAIEAVSIGKADATIVAMGMAQHFISKRGIMNMKFSAIYSQGLSDQRFGVRKDWPELASILEKALNSLSNEERLQIYQRWSLPEIANVETVKKQKWTFELTEEENAWLNKHPKISIGIIINWPPLNFVDENDRPSGIGVDYVEVLNRRLRNALVIEPAPFKENYKRVKNKTLDALMDITPQKEREPLFEFTKPYLSIPHVIVAKIVGPKYLSEKDLEGKSVALEKGYYNIIYFRKNFPDVIIKEYDSTSWALDAVARGEADAYAGNRAVANYIIEEELLGNLSMHGKLNKPPVILTIGVRKDWPILASILDKALASITNEEKREIHKKWLEEIQKVKINLTEKEQNWLKQHKTIRMGVDPHFAPFELVTEDGKYNGIAANHIRLIEKRLDLKIELVPGLAWKEVISKAKQREIDMLPCVGITEERQKFLLYTEPYLSFPRVIITRGESGVITLDDLQKFKVAVQVNSSHHGFIKEQTKIKPYLYDTFQEAMRALSRGEVEAVIGNLAVATYTIKTQNLTNLIIARYVSKESFPLAIAVRKDWPELVSILNKALDSISKESQIKLIEEWIDIDYAEDLLPYFDKMKMTAHEEAWLAEHKEIRLGIDPGWHPFDFVDELGVHQGIGSDYVSRVQKILNVNMVPQKDLSWAEMMKKAKRGEIDVIPSIVKTDEISEYLLFTKPYLELPNVLITRDDMPIIGNFSDMGGKKIAVIKGFAIEELLRRDFPDIIQVRVNNFEEALELVSSGEADGTIATFASIKYMMQKLNITNLMVSATTPYTISLRFGVRKDWPEMVKMLDKSLETITDVEKKNIQDKWTNLLVTKQIDWNFIWKIITFILTATVILISIFVVWNRKLDRAVNERTIELKQSEQVVRKSEEKYRNLFNTANDAIFTVQIEGKDVKFLDCNTRTFDLFGAKKEDIIGKSPLDFSPKTQKDGRPSEEVVKELAKAVMSGESRRFEWAHFRLDGTAFDAEISLNRVIIGDETYIQAIVRDITERKLSEEALRESEARLNEAQRIAHVGNWHYDVSTGKYAVSDEVFRIFGYEPQSVDGDYKYKVDAIHPDDRDYALKAFNDALYKNKPYNIEFRIVLSDGSEKFIFSQGIVHHDEDGKPFEMVGTVQDITERKLSEEALRKAHDELEDKVKARTKELNEANLHLKELDRLKSMFIASMSHELRTPLNSIIGFTGIILQGMAGEINDEQREQLEMVYGSAKHLLNLISDVIDISRIEAGKVETSVEEFKLDEIIKGAVLILKNQINSKGINLKLSIPDDLNMRTDKRRLLQCIINYLSNAVKFTEKGEISIKAKESDNMVEIMVKDTGIGIKEKDIPKLFKSFIRLDSPLKMRTSGTGLGLYLTKKLANEVLSGSVSVNSSYGKGSTFILNVSRELIV